MGNYCHSGSRKRDKDNESNKSEESQAYQLQDRSGGKSTKFDTKGGAPLADPEPISDISGNVPPTPKTDSEPPGSAASTTGTAKPQLKFLQHVQSGNFSDSMSGSPVTSSPPGDVNPDIQLHPNLNPLHGRSNNCRRTERDKKIVIYVLAADDGHKVEKNVLNRIYDALWERCICRDFEIQICDIHENATDNFLSVSNWCKGPVEAKGGHHLAANTLSEIARHSNSAYIVPVLLLGSTLGCPLLPHTIESQDFKTAISPLDSEEKKSLIKKWYILDSTAQPECYRLNTENIENIGTDEETINELTTLLITLVEIFSKELKDSYLTTVVEQEINNTILMSQEISKRCIWIQTGSLPPKVSETANSLEIEMNRRLNNFHLDLKNQISEKNLIRIPPTIQVQEDQLAMVLETLLFNIIDTIIEEHTNKYQIPHCTMGVDRRLLAEIETVNQHTKLICQNCVNFKIMDQVKSYVTGQSNAPLIIYGKSGSGKSVITAKIAQNIPSWVPDANLILRYTGLTELSIDITSIIGSIAEQINVLTNGVPCVGPHTVEFYAEKIANCIELIKSPILIIIDSIDEANNLENIDWIPSTLPDNVKIILTVKSNQVDIGNLKDVNKGGEDWLLAQLCKKISNNSQILQIAPFPDDQWKDILSCSGGEFYASNGTVQISEKWKNAEEKTPLQAKVLWWLAWVGETDLSDTSLESACKKVFDVMENKIGKDLLKKVISLLCVSREGLCENEILEIIEARKCNDGSVAKSWMKFCWLMGPILLHTSRIKFSDSRLKTFAIERYGTTDIHNAHKYLHDFYIKQSNIFIDKRGKYKSYNTKKLIELPYHAYHLNKKSFESSVYLTDLQWIYDKLNGTGCVHLLNDIDLIGNQQNAAVKLLKQFLINNHVALNYDGQQFYSTLRKYLVDDFVETDPSLRKDNVISKWLEILENIPIPCLLPINLKENGEPTDSEMNKVGYDSLINLGGRGYFVASINTENEEICVWDVKNCIKVRSLKGIPQPTNLCPVGDYGAAVLSRREIKVIDLNEGKFLVTLKGVMNQKMPYFGLHDPQHLVCLSRNRMYVNLMHLESGDCITTFKAGEDRFLNSLLVSGDGRILVCGDETQKPFPLLVWHLSQRKLLYDLRIPHHDFQTSLSAITHEGSYVCVVAKELNEPTPNFIVVYDLQSGTLFKKWKPNYNTVALAISQTNLCVIAGLEDARILIWDLVTGNCRCTLTGHSAPVTMLKLDPTGKVLLSGDKEGRDSSIRLWDLDTGKLLAVYTPEDKITCCEILKEGNFVVLGLKNHPNLTILKLWTGPNSGGVDTENEIVVYGEPSNEGKEFTL